MITINLQFNNSLVALSGRDYGIKTFESQVKGELVKHQDEKITVVFPTYIRKVASSFVQGFFDELLKTKGIDSIRENILIETSKPNLTAYIWDNIT